MDRLKLTLSIIRGATASTLPGANLDPAKLVAKKALVVRAADARVCVGDEGAVRGSAADGGLAATQAFFPLHEKKVKNDLFKRWVTWKQLPWQQPLASSLHEYKCGVKDYFGEKVALYFAWLGHYTAWLAPIAIVGLAVFVHQLVAGDPSVWSVTPFAVMMALWASFFMEFWKRKENRLAMEWGMTAYEETEEVRPQFRGEPIPSPATGQEILYYNPYLYLLKVFLSSTVIATTIVTVVAAVAGIFVFRVYVTQVQPLEVGGVNIGSTVASVLNAITIMLFNRMYSAVAVALNKFENHKTDTEYEDHLIAKTFLFTVRARGACAPWPRPPLTRERPRRSSSTPTPP